VVVLFIGKYIFVWGSCLLVWQQVPRTLNIEEIAMQKRFKLAALAGALSMAMSGVVYSAGHNLQFGGWSVTDGQIDAAAGDATNSVCGNTAEWDCSTVASGDGFKQIQVTAVPGTQGAVAGESYIMTIVTDQNANGTPGSTQLGFYDVSFVKMKLSLGGGSTANNNENGIAAQQRISEIGTTGGGGTSFTSTSDINTGWSQASTPVSITQNLSDEGDTASAGDDFNSNFLYQSSNDATTGLRDGFQMSIDQVAGLASANDALSDQDVQVFSLRERQGSLQTSANATGISLANGDAATWASGDDIKAIWIGQKINLDSQTNNAGSLGSTFGFLSFENVSAPGTTLPASEFGFANSNSEKAWAWDPAFNIGSSSGTPCITDPTGQNCP